MNYLLTYIKLYIQIYSTTRILQWNTIIKLKNSHIGIGECFWQRGAIFPQIFPGKIFKKSCRSWCSTFVLLRTYPRRIMYYVYTFFSLSSFCCFPTACRNSAKCSKTQMASGRFARFVTAVEFLQAAKQENSPENPWKNKNVNKGRRAEGADAFENVFLDLCDDFLTNWADYAKLSEIVDLNDSIWSKWTL